MEEPKKFAEKIREALINNIKRDTLSMFLYCKYGIGGTIQDEEDKAKYKEIYGKEF